MSRQLPFAHIEEDDPFVMEFFSLGAKLYDVFEAQLREIGVTPTSTRGDVAKARWTMYIGTLFGENYLASTHLALLGMPRAQTTLNRQLFEYYIRNQWWLIHPDLAADLLESLPALKQKELNQVKGKSVVDPTFIDAVEQQYQAWVKSSPLATSKLAEAPVKDIVNKLTHGNPDREFYYQYSIPSIIAHAKAQGIMDVLKPCGPEQLQRHPDSLWFDRTNALVNSIGLMFQYIVLLACHFKLAKLEIQILNAQFKGILQRSGIGSEEVGVKFKT